MAEIFVASLDRRHNQARDFRPSEVGGVRSCGIQEAIDPHECLAGVQLTGWGIASMRKTAVQMPRQKKRPALGMQMGQAPPVLVHFSAIVYSIEAAFAKAAVGRRVVQLCEEPADFVPLQGRAREQVLHRRVSECSGSDPLILEFFSLEWGLGRSPREDFFENETNECHGIRKSNVPS